jgi:hypothetical protein
MRRLKENVIEMNGRENQFYMNVKEIFKWTRDMANMHCNLTCIDKELHAEKTAYFSMRSNPALPMSERLRAYLTACAKNLSLGWGLLKCGTGEMSIHDVMERLEKDPNVSKKIKDAIESVLQQGIKDFLAMPWAQEDESTLFKEGETWPISREIFP